MSFAPLLGVQVLIENILICEKLDRADIIPG